MAKTKKYISMILKHAEKLKEPEFGTQKAAEELRAWVLEQWEPQPPLSMKHCSFFPRCLLLHDPKPLLRTQSTCPDETAAPAVPLEPKMGSITMSGVKASNKRKQRHHQAEDEAESQVSFMTQIVQFLIGSHGFNVEEANKIAHEAWRKKASGKQRKVAPDAAGSDQEPCPLDVQPRDGVVVRLDGWLGSYRMLQISLPPAQKV